MYELIVGGCSGSNTPAHSRPIFGHLTTSFGLLDRANRRGIVIDNGTGVQVVAKEMVNDKVAETTIVQTHFHSDHLEGLQLNGLLFGDTVQEIIAPVLPGVKMLDKIYHERFDPSAWPVAPSKSVGYLYFGAGISQRLKLPGNVWVDTLGLNHPGGCVGYRFTLPDGQVIVIATDNELISEGPLRQEYGNFVSGADVLIADVQYTQDEYDGVVSLGSRTVSRKGWGHSTPEMLAETLSAHCKSWPRNIYLTHHDPSRTDDDLIRFENQAVSVSESFELLSLKDFAVV